jgi:cell division protein FtsW (lipid II flippase)
MRKFVRRQLTYFLIGFVFTFIIYLFVRFDSDQVILGVVIGAVGGVALAALLFWLGRKFPDDEPEPTPATRME